MKQTTDYEMQLKYKHFTTRKIPFEDEIIDVAPTSGIFYSDRDEWIRNLYFITKKGYYFKYSDFYASNTHYEKDDNQPFVVYLDGILKAAYVYAFSSELEGTIRFIVKNLMEGKICVTKYIRGIHLNKYHFTFTLPYYSYIGAEDRDN